MATTRAKSQKHERLESNTRLAILTLNMSLASLPVKFALRCDSLSPLGSTYNARSYRDSPYKSSPQEKDSLGSNYRRAAVRREDANVKMNAKQQAHHALHAHDHAATAIPPATATEAAITTATSPRSRYHHPRPDPLHLRRSFGCTALKSADLKQRICDSTSTDPTATVVQVLLDDRQPLPPTPTTPFTERMGNKPSSVSGDVAADDSSFRSVVRRDSRQPVSRKGSFNIFKRVDSKSPLPRDVTASVMSILHRDGHKKDDSCTTDDDGLVSVPTDPFFDQPDLDDGRYPDVRPAIHSASTVTMTEARAALPLSASTTIRDCRSTDQSPVQFTQADGVDDFNDLSRFPSTEEMGLSPLSPTIPAPSPLPEDSPHKYGLRDKIETPEVPEAVHEEINVTKMRRKSSGLEIFNEAKSLQSAQSFLNGLSTARRRAESATAVQSTENFDSARTKIINATSRPGSTRPPSARPQPSYQDGEGRRKGHNFKASGFAYSRPLNVAQLKCYRGHGRLINSRNKYAQVECAVCHIDDDGDHFSCSWCAMRMCRLCRDDFAKRGLRALRERIRKAELGGGRDSAGSSSSEESLGLRKTKSTSFA